MHAFPIAASCVFAMMTPIVVKGAALVDDRLPPELQLEQPWQTGWACGPNSLYFLMRFNGKNVDFFDLRKSLPIREGGNSIAELQDAAATHGLRLLALKTSRSGLAAIQTPFIAHLRAPPGDGGHFLVVLRISDADYDVIDGSQATVQRVSAEVFHQFWTGHILASGTQRQIVNSILSGVSLIALIAIIALAPALMRSLKRSSDSWRVGPTWKNVNRQSAGG